MNSVAPQAANGTSSELKKTEGLSFQLGHPSVFQSKIELDVELGVIEMTLHDLADLTPGGAFAFSFDPEKPLALSLGKEKIADAIFVEKDGELMLQIEKVYE